MLKKIIFVLILVSSSEVFGQDSLTSAIKKWFSEDIESDINLASGFYYDDCSYLGIFGNNNYKFNMRFDSVGRKSFTQIYYIEGRSLLRGKVVSFQGEIEVDRIELYFIEPLSLVISGSYRFVEKSGGVFEGVFRKYMSNINRGSGNPIFGNIDAEIGHKEGFAGIWIDPKTAKDYKCLFGFNSYPEILAHDFDLNGGVPSINPDYKKHGWSEFFEKNEDRGFYGNTECNYDWWK